MTFWSDRIVIHPEYGKVLWAITFVHIADAEDPADCTEDRSEWPMVPRVGEDVELSCEDHPDGHSGTVRAVMWDDIGQPQVRYR